jgi:Tfp pilus assembly protein PilF
MGLKPGQDYQYAHHLLTLMLSLTHDGRFAEARRLKKECEALKYYHRQEWFRLHVAERNWDEALKIANYYRKSDKIMASYLAAVVYLKKNDAARAAPEVAVLQQAYEQKRTDKVLERRLWETLGMRLCQQGQADAGLKLLAKAVEKTKDDYSHHAWGNGAYYMETWGIAALQANKPDVAEEAFLESLAHDARCVRAALGLQVLCERQGRSEEAARYAELAHRCWAKADPADLLAQYEALRATDHAVQAPAAQTSTTTRQR